MLRQRLLSVAVLVPVAAGAVYLGGLWFFALVALAAGLAGREFFGMMAAGGYRPSLPFGLALIFLLLLEARRPCGLWGRFCLALIVIGSLLWHLAHPPLHPPTGGGTGGRQNPALDWALTLAGGLYLGWLSAHFIYLREMPNGAWWAVFTFATAWLGDAGAYFVGRRWGRHHLSPRLSPGKTWEGAIAGALCTLAAAFLFGPFLGLSLLHRAILGLAVAAVSPFGDLAVSMFKRQAKIKDSGGIIPGHGGMLDRIDTVLFAVVVVYYYLVFVIEH